MMRRPWDIIAFQDPPDEMSFMSVVKASGYRLLTQSYVPLTEELHPSFKKASKARKARTKHRVTEAPAPNTSPEHAGRNATTQDGTMPVEEARLLHSVGFLVHSTIPRSLLKVQ